MSPPADPLPSHAIAVIGMAGRFPGAADVRELFANLCAGREGVTFFQADELDPSIPADERDDPRYVRARGILADHDRFDAEFFGITPLEAQVLDPQHRLLLELAWAALEHSGHRPADVPGRVGVYVGSLWSQYQTQVVATRPDVLAQFGKGNATLANEQDFLATRISYKLGLRGPSYTVGTACSTSLVAITQAARALANRECDLALAGGVSISVPVKAGYLCEPGGMLSPDGHCRPFDAAAAGTTFGDGAGLVVLRRLADALADGDHVYAVIRGFAVNNDGADKVSFTAPSVTGQAEVLREALQHAAVDPDSIGYVETHGTATAMGDPIEFAALLRAYQGRRPGTPPCALGAVKSSVGHLVHAAGVTGFLAATLAVHEGVIPPVLHFATPNPRLQLDGSRFFVAREPRQWPPTGSPRRAGISSFGVGGTNAHVVIEAAPTTTREAPRDEPRWLCVSARTAAALQRQVANLGDHLAKAGADLSLTDVAFTLATGREAMRYRWLVHAESIADAVQALANGKCRSGGHATVPRRVLLQFPGHGVQRIGMARDLYERFPTSRQRLDDGIAWVLQHGGPDLRPVLLGGAADEALDSVHHAHPALFLCQLATADALAQMGLVADALLGCSLGEFAAAVLAGVLTFEDALATIMASGEAILAAPAGSMFTAYCSEAEARAITAPGLSIAAVYSSDAVVLAGDPTAVAAGLRACAASRIRTTPLRADRAFHTPFMDSAVAALSRSLASLQRQPPQRPLYSAALGRALTAAEATSATHWAGILTAPVHYEAALRTAAEEDEHVMVEVGPGVTLTALALAHPAVRTRPIAALPGAGQLETTIADLREVVSHCWAHGGTVTFTWPTSARRVALPTYPFERTRHWLEAGAPTHARPRPNDVAPATTLPTTGAGGHSLAERMVAVLASTSGLTIDAQETKHWAELGFDSLLTTQLAIGLRRAFDVTLGFRDLMERHGSPRALLHWLTTTVRAAPAPVPEATPAGDAAPTPTTVSPATTPTVARPAQRPNPGARIERTVGERHRMTGEQQRFLTAFCSDYAARTQRSKAFAQAHRRPLADPRTVTGFHPLWKEIVYPIVTDRSRGSRLWDIDGNEYIDVLNGFGSILFGHAPDFVTDAVREQLGRGIEIGPQTPLAGDVARLFCELTGQERVGFANTGSEAVTAALRIARTVTGRSKVVLFEGAYHGIQDEVIVRAGRDGMPVPASPGIPPSHVAEVVVLPYGTDDSLHTIERLGRELAAVLVEPIQGRNPDLQPVAFLRRLREITAANGTALILDEVVTGFRAHPGGVQALFGIQADLALYGKVVAGGHPIGLVAGKASWMDALDGGQWQFGDDSVPEVGVTFFAGTFVRHPLALAAARAVLLRLQAAGPRLQEELTGRTRAMVDRLNTFLRTSGVGIHIASGHSTFFSTVDSNEPWGSLLFAMLRQRGIHIWEQFPCFLTTSHSDADVAAFERHYREAVGELLHHGFLSRRAEPPAAPAAALPPVAGARVGRRPDGSLAWFIADPDRPGRFLAIADVKVE